MEEKIEIKEGEIDVAVKVHSGLHELILLYLDSDPQLPLFDTTD